MNKGSKSEIYLGFATAAIVAVIGAMLAAIPELETTKEALVALVIGATLLVPAIAVFARQLRTMFSFRNKGDEVTGYTFDAETGQLVKGNIENVSLRVSSMHKTIDALVSMVPAEMRVQALKDAGYRVGENWASSFKQETWNMQGLDGDVSSLLVRWAEYDASAGMGRITVALTPDNRSGLAMVANSFLSREPSDHPMNQWFAGYIAGTLDQLLADRFEVELLDHSVETARIAAFKIAKSD